MGEYSAQWTHNAGKSSDASTSNVETARNERRSYKNISICITELPPTPTKFRDKYHRARVPHSKPPIVFKPGEGRTDRPWIGGYGAAHAHSIRRTQPAIPVVVRRPQTTQFRAIQPVHVVRRPQTDSIRIRGPKAIPEIGKRPQTHQLSPISTVCVDPRPHTFGFDSPNPAPTKPLSALQTRVAIPKAPAIPQAFESMHTGQKLESYSYMQMCCQIWTTYTDQEFREEVAGLQSNGIVCYQIANKRPLYSLCSSTRTRCRSGSSWKCCILCLDTIEILSKVKPTTWPTRAEISPAGTEGV
jgi:hypothetical protein